VLERIDFVSLFLSSLTHSGTQALLVADCSPSGDHNLFNGDISSSPVRGLGHDGKQEGAAGDFHAQDLDALDIVCPEDVREPLEVQLLVVELRAAQHQHAPLEKVAVEIGVGRGHAVGGHQQIAVLEEGRRGRDEPGLYGPMGQGRPGGLRYSLR